MKRAVLLVAIALLHCKKTPSATRESDAGSPSASSSAARPRVLDGGARSGLSEPPVMDASGPVGAKEPPPLPLASDALEVVAIGKTYNSRILWAHALGKRFWLSGSNVDAFAEGDGPLVKGPDILQKLPYKY